ncbi:hypothetical protein [Amycolatopsis sp.]|jgi:hypothetical protein|uniref:hypothetical protein n=1 Tax=Amycolatopsis sp. TaxID=37632 RepID=UPI002E027C16|nr:hypothetical protein [Amycolatopsis sp.]
MAEQGGFPVVNFLLYAVVVVAPTALALGALKVPGLVRKAKRPKPSPEHPPIQELAADLRRVHRLLAQFAPGTPMARRTGTRQAYDALLTDACDAVEIPNRLGEIPEGMDREIERLRVEESLRTAGLSIP